MSRIVHYPFRLFFVTLTREVKNTFLAMIMAIATAAIASSCGKSKIPVNEEFLEDSSTEGVARLILGAVNASGTITPDPNATCKVSTGESQINDISCQSQCVNSLYQVDCLTTSKKKYTCGVDQFDWTNGSLSGTSNFSGMTWKSGHKPVGTQETSFKLKGVFDHLASQANSLVTTRGELDCSVSAQLTFSEDRDLPALTLDCAKTRCVLSGTHISCSDLQRFLIVNLCEQL